MEEWDIQSRSEACVRCRSPFVEKGPYHTILTHTPEGYRRQDLCSSCWTTLGGKVIRQEVGIISCWQGMYESSQLSPIEPLPKEDAESLLRKMLERNDLAELEARYILAVMLERKRILRHRETQRLEEPILVYEHVKTGEVFMITDPKIRLDQLGEIQKRVAAMLRTS